MCRIIEDSSGEQEHEHMIEGMKLALFPYFIYLYIFTLFFLLQNGTTFTCTCKIRNCLLHTCRINRGKTTRIFRLAPTVDCFIFLIFIYMWPHIIVHIYFGMPHL